MVFDAEHEVTQLQNRMVLCEEVLNQCQTAILNLATLEQLNQLLLIKQKEVGEIKIDITALENQVELLRAEVFK